MRLTSFSLSFLLSAVMLTAGCMASQTSPVPTTAPRGGALNFFEQGQGTGTISIRLIDNRRSTQAFADAADFSAVRFELRNTSKLKAPRIKGVSANAGTYSTVFTDLPSDTQARYVLTAGLFSGVLTPGDPAEPGYSNLDQKVGEGSSAAFTLTAGESKTITLVINAVGEIRFGSDSATINNSNPAFTAGDATAKGLITLSAAKNPEATALRYSIVGADNVTKSTATIAKGAWLAPPFNTSLPFTAPSTAGTYRLVAEMLNGTQVLSRRTRNFSVEASLTFTGTFGSFVVNGTSFTSHFYTYYSVPASGSTVTLTFINNSEEELVFGQVNGPNSLTGYVGLGSLLPNSSVSYTLPVVDGQVHLVINS